MGFYKLNDIIAESNHFVLDLLEIVFEHGLLEGVVLVGDHKGREFLEDLPPLVDSQFVGFQD